MNCADCPCGMLQFQQYVDHFTKKGYTLEEIRLLFDEYSCLYCERVGGFVGMYGHCPEYQRYRDTCKSVASKRAV